MLFSIAIVGGYSVVSFKQYLRIYQTTQIQEIEIVCQKTEAALKQLEDLLDLTESLISTTIPKTFLKTSKFDLEVRLREILQSVSLLKPDSDLPSLQKVAFYKLTLPQMIITRFGALFFDSTKIPHEKLMIHHWNSELVLEENSLVGRVNVGKLKGTLQGLLEIQVTLVSKVFGSLSDD